MSTTALSPELITARLDRLPVTRHIWLMVVLISLGGLFENYDIFFTAYIAPGLFRDGVITPTTVSFFGMTGLASFIAALFFGMFIGTIAVCFVADRFGRRVIFVSALLWYCAATLMLAFQDSANGLNFWRFLGGIGVGVEQITIDAYLSELVPKHVRGKAFAFQQGVSFFAVPIVAFLAWLLVPATPFGISGWRWVVILGSIGAIFVWFVRLGLPESPRWLAQQGRLEEAERVISTIEAKVQAQTGRALPPIDTPKPEFHRVGSYREMFSPAYRGRTILLMVFHIAETVGIYGFGNWMPTLLIAKGIHVTQSLEYMFVIALAYPAWPLIASLFASRIELKWQMCIGATGIATFGLLMITQQMPLPIIVIGILLACSSCWLSFSFHAYQSELYPTRMRARAVGFVYSWSRLSVVFTSYAIAAVLGVFGVPGVFGFIALAMAVVIVSIAAFGPRTNQLALEEISR